VLVGTRLVTKRASSRPWPLVGIVSADIALNLPDERSAERTTSSASGDRSGRGGARPGRAIIQTYVPDHPAIRAVADGDSETFHRDELAARRRFGAPPFGRYIKLTVALEDRAAAEAAGRTMAGTLRTLAQEASSDTVVLGPVPAYIARRGGRWRFHLVLRGTDPGAVLRADPGPPWSVDVDPESLL
jgi:primosomal protein N' (replication factor Y)